MYTNAPDQQFQQAIASTQNIIFDYTAKMTIVRWIVDLGFIIS